MTREESKALVNWIIGGDVDIELNPKDHEQELELHEIGSGCYWRTRKAGAE